MGRSGGRTHARADKLAAVARLQSGEGIVALSRELGVHRTVLWQWRAKYEAGGVTGLRGRGRVRRSPPAAGVPAASSAADDLASARARIAALERTVGQQQLELDFFEHALRQVETSGRAYDAPGATASTP